jgi:hypothetical protein
MEFPAGYTEAILMLYQGKTVAGSNGYMITRICSLAGREKPIVIFETNRRSEKA